MARTGLGRRPLRRSRIVGRQKRSIVVLQTIRWYIRVVRRRIGRDDLIVRHESEDPVTPEIVRLYAVVESLPARARPRKPERDDVRTRQRLAGIVADASGNDSPSRQFDDQVIEHLPRRERQPLANVRPWSLRSVAHCGVVRRESACGGAQPIGAGWDVLEFERTVRICRALPRVGDTDAGNIGRRSGRKGDDGRRQRRDVCQPRSRAR
jgi:hypothetical protein